MVCFFIDKAMMRKQEMMKWRLGHNQGQIRTFISCMSSTSQCAWLVWVWLWIQHCFLLYVLVVFDPLFFLGRGQKEDPAVNAVVCHSPLSNLGYCRKGSTISVSVAFQILRAGLFEVKIHYVCVCVCVWDILAIPYFISLPSTKPMSYITGSTHLNICYSILCF